MSPSGSSDKVDGLSVIREQALPVLKAGKTMFIDKPIAASLEDAIVIFEAAKHFQVPVFSASSLRFIPSAIEVSGGKIGKVLGADTFSPASLHVHGSRR